MMDERSIKFEILQLKERVNKLEQINEKDQKVISLLLQINSYLFDYINDTADHVIRLEAKEKKEEKE